MKTISKGLFIIVFFFGLWFLLAQIDFVSLFKINSLKTKTESSIGDLIWKQIETTEDVIYDISITNTLDSLLLPLCQENNINRDNLKIHIIQKEEINAFAMPDNHLVVYTGLILNCKNEQALLGILGHEIAHIEEKHVMKKLSKEIGFSVLMSLSGANSGAIKEILQTLSSTAYDRGLEQEADIKSVQYMLNAGINPKPFADFMYELSLNNGMHEYVYWLSTHPESEARAKYILNYLKGKKIKNKQILGQQNWKAFQQKIKDN